MPRQSRRVLQERVGKAVGDGHGVASAIGDGTLLVMG